MRYCKKCVMPDTRPGMTFNGEGVCSACQAYEKRKNVNYQQRFGELKVLCDKYRGMNGPNGYDSIIAVSGGKDSHFQVHVVKEQMGMNPLLVTVEDNFPMTNAGLHNLKNISEAFGCDIISMKPNIKAQKVITKKTFEKYGKPTYFIDRYIYTYPLHMALKFNTPLLVYGENVSYEYGGANAEETYSAKEQIFNGVASGIPIDELLIDGVTLKDLNFFEPPPNDELQKLDPIYLSYFVKWNSYSNYIFAKSRGFHDLTHEWQRTHHIEQFDQVDSRAYLVHSWLKYPKFGHATATDYASRFIRYGLLTREEAIELVKKHDHDLDPLAIRDFIEFAGYTEKEFWEIVDKLYNEELFEKNAFGVWCLSNPVSES
jgi:N-acetyl sugar amidotransferase